jgi:hypothetical protein
MKSKLILYLIILSTASGVVAQVPNGGFETWTTDTLIFPQKWSTFGDAELTASAIKGLFAMKLENKVPGNGFAMFTNANLKMGEQQLNGGWPYSEKPDSFGFYAKYNLAPGDTALAVLFFKRLGLTLASSTIQIGGNSNGNTNRFVAPIKARLTVNPDTVLLIVFSHHPDSNAKGNGYIIVDDLFLKDGSTPSSNLVNYNFELVTQTNYDKLDKWFTVNDFIIAFKPTKFPVYKSTDAYKGTYSCYLKNETAIPSELSLVPGVILTNNRPEEDVPSFPVTDTWRFLNGYYKFNADAGDSAFVTVEMYKAGKKIGSGTFYENNSKTAWTSFSNFIVYSDPQIPDSATIMIGCSNPDNPKGTNTELWIDELVFSKNGAGVTDQQNAQMIRTSPNPFSEVLQIEINEKSNHQIELLDISGKMVWSANLIFGKGTFDLSHLESGVYMLRYSNQFYTGICKIIKQ